MLFVLRNKDKYKDLSGSLKSYVRCHPQNQKLSGARIVSTIGHMQVLLMDIVTWQNGSEGFNIQMIFVVERKGEQMSDLIDREDAIDDLHSKSQLQIWDTEDVEVWINDLPSASTDLSTFSDKLWKNAYERGKAEGRKKGKWIYGEKSGQDGWYCSECGGFIPWYYDFYGLDNIDFIEDFKTCPFCDSKMVSYTGADMREGEEE